MPLKESKDILGLFMQDSYSSCGREEKLDILLPGTSLSQDNRIHCKSMFLIYRGVSLEKTEYRTWITNEVILSELDVDVEEMRVSHRKHLIRTELYRYTYVIICLSSSVRTRRCELFRYNEVQPEIRVLKTRDRVDEALQYIEDWIPESEPELVGLMNKDILEDKKLVLEKDPLEGERIALENERAILRQERIALDKERAILRQERIALEKEKTTMKIPPSHAKAEVMYTSDRPLKFHVSNFLGWQTQLLMKMNEQCHPDYRELPDPTVISYMDYNQPPMEYPHLRECVGLVNRKIRIIYCFKNEEAGITTFLKALKYPGINPDPSVSHPKIKNHNSNRFLIIIGIPDHQEFLKEADRQREQGWTGECVIFDLTYSNTINDESYATLFMATDEQTCRSIWVFTKRMFNPERTMYSRWEFYSISAHHIRGSISGLYKMGPREVEAALPKK